MLLTQTPYYYPEWSNKIKVNRSVAEDDTQFAACHDSVAGNIYLHHSYVTGDRWDQWGVDGLALLLFGEWQHIEEPYWTERQCQAWLEQWRQEVGWQNVAPEIYHEYSDGGGDP